jgi:hypothetical protein
VEVLETRDDLLEAELKKMHLLEMKSLDDDFEDTSEVEYGLKEERAQAHEIHLATYGCNMQPRVMKYNQQLLRGAH